MGSSGLGRRPAIAVGAGALMASVLLLAQAPPIAAAGETLAAECAPPRDAYLQNNSANERFAMTFVSGQTGALTRAEIDYQEPAGHQFPLRVQILGVDPGTGAPTDAVLAETSVEDQLPGPTTLVANFATPVNVATGESYALALSRPGAGALAYGWGYSASPGACLGKFFNQPGSAGPWNGSIANDMIFRIFVDDTAFPDTTITKQPKGKTRRKRATFEFSGTDIRALAGFECSLDGGAYAACFSPHTVKVKRGKHTFSVRAIDQAGNVDGAPATDDWKVKKKKKKKKK